MKEKYVQAGLGGRARFFYEAIASTYHQTCELIGFCDISQIRMDYANRTLVNKYGQKETKTCMPSRFEQLPGNVRPAEVIITSVDRTHHDYIIRAMKKGYGITCEKPLTIDEEKVQEIITVQKQTGRSLRVTFSHRYAPYHMKIRELIESDVIDDVFPTYLEQPPNTQHGVDCFRRWHRNKRNSGGLLVHKSIHHFDPMNSRLNSRPQKVFAFGGLNFYGIHNVEKYGVEMFYNRCYGSELAKVDPFTIDLSASEELQETYLGAEKDSGHICDRSVLSDDIPTKDTPGITVKYETGVILTYSLNVYMPWEGFNVSSNGSKGWIKTKVIEKFYINAGRDKKDEGVAVP